MAEKEKKNKAKPFLFSLIVWIIRIFYRKRTLIGTENIPQDASLIIGNHAQIHGPITSQLFFPGYKYIWCIGQMMHIKEVKKDNLTCRVYANRDEMGAAAAKDAAAVIRELLKTQD